MSRYAPKVRALRYSYLSFSDETDEGRTLQALKLKVNHGRTPLLPHLVELHILQQLGTQGLLQLAIFLHPGLLTLSFPYHVEYPVNCAIFSAATSIRSLDISSDSSFEPVVIVRHTKYLENMLGMLRCLERLSTHVPTSRASLRHLAAQPFLRAMSIRVPQVLKRSDFGPGAFAALEELDVMGYVGSSFALLSRISSPNLSQLSLYLGQDNSQLSAACSIVRQYFAQSIRRIDIHLVFSTRRDNPFEDIQPLLVCGRLVELSL